jgi:hypothetical protein
MFVTLWDHKPAGLAGRIAMVEALELIIVKPTAAGWRVDRPRCAQAQTFQSGATAEAAARQLGEAIARGGQPAEIRIFLRDGSLAGRFLCPA